MNDEQREALTGQASEPRPGPLKRLYQGVTCASSDLVQREDRRRAELMAGLLICAIPIAIVAMFLAAITRHHPLSVLELSQQAGSLLLLVAAYPLSRTRHFRLAALLAVSVLMAGNWLALSQEAEALRVVGLLGTTAAGILVCACVLSVRTTLVFSLINLAAAVTIPSLHPTITLEMASPALWSLFLLTALIVLVGATMNQDLDDLDHRHVLLEASDERYALVASATNDALWDWNIAASETYFSERWLQLVGTGDLEGPGLQGWLSRVHPDDAASLDNDIAAHLGGTTDHLENTHRVLHAMGDWRWVLARGKALRDGSGKVTRFAGSVSDITESKQFEQRLLHDAFHDGLTGLGNRALLMDRIRVCDARSQRDKSALFAVLFLDIDSFKLVNDSLGHNVGDQLLIHVADQLRGCVGPNDTVARLGGDDFIILLDDVAHRAGVLELAQTIHGTLSESIVIGGQSITTAVSIGVAMSDMDYARPEHLLRDADTAMYRSKSEGPGQTKLFERGMHASAVSRLHLENELRFAVERDELFLVYQPIVGMQSMRVLGFEALVRWQHPQRGLLSPIEFIPVAEETGIIEEIDQWVLREACQQQAAWRAEFGAKQPMGVNVNVSGRQFRHHGMSLGVRAVMEETGVDPRDLQIELTETVIMNQASASQRAITGLRNRGVRVCVDDFGTGYSSLSYLDAFDLDGLKIDRSFVQGIRPDAGPPKIVQAIISLGHNLGLKVTAEGVEDTYQLNALREMGCDTAQGYLLARPMRVEQASELLKTPIIHA